MRLSPHTAQAFQKAIPFGNTRLSTAFAIRVWSLLTSLNADGRIDQFDRHLLFHLQRFSRFSRNETPDGRQLAFAPGMLPHDPVSSLLQAGLGFFHPPQPAPPQASLTGRFP